MFSCVQSFKEHTFYDFLNHVQESKYIEETHIDDRSIRHNLFSLIISQKIRFSESMRIHRKLYSLLKYEPSELGSLDGLMTCEREDVIDIVGSKKYEIMERVHYYLISCLNIDGSYATLNEEVIRNAGKLKGIGKWTVQCCLLRKGYPLSKWVDNDASVNTILEMLRQEWNNNVSNKQVVFHVDQRHLNGTLFSKFWVITRGSLKERRDWVVHSVHHFLE